MVLTEKVLKVLGAQTRRSSTTGEGKPEHDLPDFAQAGFLALGGLVPVEGVREGLQWWGGRCAWVFGAENLYHGGVGSIVDAFREKVADCLAEGTVRHQGLERVLEGCVLQSVLFIREGRAGRGAATLRAWPGKVP